MSSQTSHFFPVPRASFARSLVLYEETADFPRISTNLPQTLRLNKNINQQHTVQSTSRSKYRTVSLKYTLL